VDFTVSPTNLVFIWEVLLVTASLLCERHRKKQNKETDAAAGRSVKGKMHEIFVAFLFVSGHQKILEDSISMIFVY
jgi:hypothetical protein